MGFKSKLSRDIMHGKRRLSILYGATHSDTITNTPCTLSVPWPKQCDLTRRGEEKAVPSAARAFFQLHV
jgi:hypothetical protein